MNSVKNVFRGWKLIIALIIFACGAVSIPSQVLAPKNDRTAKENDSKESKSNGTENSGVLDIAGKYRIIFAPDYFGKLRFRYDETDQARSTRKSQSNKILDLLNAQGDKNYKLLSGVGNDFFLMKNDEAKFEYLWFETLGSYHFEKSGLRKKISESSGSGFRISYHNLLRASCDPLDQNNLALGEECEYLDFYFIEKEKDSTRKIEQALVALDPGWGTKPSEAIESVVDERLSDGFFPVIVFSPFELLLERSRASDIDYRPEIGVVRSSWGRGDALEKANELAKQGYRLALVSNRIAVLYRNRETENTRYSYVSMSADKKNLDTDIAALEKRGAIFRTIYPSAKGTQNTLLFEVNENQTASRSELKIVKLKFLSTEDSAEYKVVQHLIPESKTVLDQLRSLVKEGYEVRSLFNTGQTKHKGKTFTFELGILLERTK